MATIGNDRMIVRGERRADDSWLFTVCYTAQFSDADLGQQFDDTVQISEIRRGARARICEHPVSFRATGPRVFRKKRIVVRGDEYDTEIGLDTVWAWIRLHRCSETAVADEQHTPALSPTPNGRSEQQAVRRCAPADSLRC